MADPAGCTRDAGTSSAGTGSAGTSSAGTGHAGTSSGAAQSALLVPVPEAEPLVGRWRERLDPVAAAGVPAHVTLIVPWVPPSVLGDGHIEALGEVLGEVEPWSFTLAGTGLFGTRVLWLEPQPADGFLRLTERLAAAFGTPPWAGEFAEVVPHLTVAHAGGGTELAEVARRVAPGLPLRCEAKEVWVMVADGTRWSVTARLALRGARAEEP